MDVQVKPGQRFLKYELRREIGRGGMGVVFEAWDTELLRTVCLKVLYPHLLTEPGTKDLTWREARAAAAITHPNVVRVHTVVTEGGITAIDMEFIAGRPLHTVVSSGSLGVRRTVQILAQVLGALDACHQKGMAHLDLKPGNVLLTSDGHVYVTDFGLAQAISQGASARKAEVNRCWTTPRYAPPELWTGESPCANWDVYGAGVLACECINGFRINPDLIRSEAGAAEYGAMLTATLPVVSPSLKTLIQDMINRSTDMRPQDAGTALALLRETPEYRQVFSETRPPGAEAADVETQTVRVNFTEVSQGKARPLATPIFLALVLAIICAGVTFSNLHRKSVATPQSESGPATRDTATSDNTSKVVPPSSNPMDLVECGGLLYFTADDGIHGRKVWVANEDGPKCILEGPTVCAYQQPHWLLAADDLLYFTAETPESGTELYRCQCGYDGKASLRMVREIGPGAMGCDPRCIAWRPSTMLFTATTPGAGCELWATLGSDALTAIVADLNLGPGGSAPHEPRIAIGEKYTYFCAYGGSPPIWTLYAYKYDNHEVKAIGKLEDGRGPVWVKRDRALVINTDPEHGTELWIADAASGELHMLKDLYPGRISSDPGEFAALGDCALFRATTPEYGNELWITDGTEAGTHLLRDINPGPAGSNPYALRAGSKFVTIRADDKTHGNELWASDGTEAGTQLVADVCPGPKGSVPYNIAPHDNYIAFSADDAVHGEELFLAIYDGVNWSASLVKDIAPGPESSCPYRLVWARSPWISDEIAYFNAKSPAIGLEFFQLRVINKQKETVVTAFDLRPGTSLESSDQLAR